MLLSKATNNWGMHKVIHLYEANINWSLVFLRGQYLDPFSFPHTLHHWGSSGVSSWTLPLLHIHFHHWVHHTSTFKNIKRFILKRQTSTGHWGSSGVSTWTPPLLHIHFHHWVPSYKHINIHKVIHLKEENINWSLGFLRGQYLDPSSSPHTLHHWGSSGIGSWTPTLLHIHYITGSHHTSTLEKSWSRRFPSERVR